MKKISIKEKISTLWIVVMFTMAFADILGFVLPEVLSNIVEGKTDLVITQPLLLVMAVFVEIPIIMIFLSRILNWKINRIINIIAAIITILFIILGGSIYLHYIFFAAVEVVCLVVIIIYSIKNSNMEVSNYEFK